jgi:hypothetical protein
MYTADLVDVAPGSIAEASKLHTRQNYGEGKPINLAKEASLQKKT